MKSNLATVRVFLDSGKDYITNVNGNCSDELIRLYFVGARFTRDDEVTQDTCTKIEITR